jgi:hypothetical protein
VKRYIGRERTEQGRFLAKFLVDDGCWEWQASRMKGPGTPTYGFFGKSHGPVVLAHRYSYEMFVGPIPESMQVRHTCDNRTCVNPSHLELGSHQDNMDDRTKRGRHHNANKTHCIHGHDFETNTRWNHNGTKRDCEICYQNRLSVRREARRVARAGKD